MARRTNPATSDRVYSDDEAELLRAVADWRARTGVRFPLATDYLAILKGLGYRREAAPPAPPKGEDVPRLRAGPASRAAAG